MCRSVGHRNAGSDTVARETAVFAARHLLVIYPSLKSQPHFKLSRKQESKTGQTGDSGQLQAVGMMLLLVRFVGSDWKMEARFREIIFNVRVWIAVIVSLCGGFEKLSGE